MTQETEKIIGVAMPALTAIGIADSMYESNKMLKIFMHWTNNEGEEYDCYFVAKTLDGVGVYNTSTDKFEERSEYGEYEMVTITAITPIIPTYSVGDRVMIIATGEIGEIERLWGTNDEYIKVVFRDRSYKAMNGDEIYPFVDELHRSEIAKLPAIQLPSE